MMSLNTRKWADLDNKLDALTPEDRAEINLKVRIIGEILSRPKTL
jgi:hypothetical protein